MNIQKEISLEDTCLFINGGAWSDKEYVSEGIPVVKVTNIQNGRVNMNDVCFLPLSSLGKYNRHTLLKGDLVITTVGSHPNQPNSVVGRTAVISDIAAGSLLNQNAVCVRVIKKNIVCQKFLTYLVETRVFKHHIESRAKGSANQVRIAIGELKKFSFKFPPLSTQRRIASILFAYDELIENNNQRIKILEEMAEQLYREWFVRMRFPGYESVRMSKGVPEGWEVVPFSTIAQEVRRNIKADHLPKDMPYIGLEHLPRKSITIQNWDSTDSVNSNKLKFQKGEVLFCKIRPYLHKVALAHFDGICSSDTIIIKPRNEKYKGLVTMTAFSTVFVDFADITSKGTKMPRADWKVMKTFKIFLPPGNLIEKYNSITYPIFSELGILVEKNTLLRRTRDLLLPRLMSGQLAVKEAEASL